MITAGMKETFTVKTLVMVLVAVVGYMVARLLQEHVVNRIDVLRRIPEVSDVVVMVTSASLLKGDMSQAATIGAGISLVNNLGARFRIDWLRVS